MFWTSIFIEPMEVLFAGTQAALNVFVQSTVLIGIGLAAGWILRAKGAAVRSVVYRTTFVVVLLCPVLSWIGLSPRIESMAIPRPSLDVGNYDLAAMEPPRTAEAAFRAEAEAAREPAAAVPSTVEKTPQPEARVLTANGSSRVRSADVWSLLAVAWSAAWLGVTGFLFARLALSSVRSIHARFRARAASSAILAECGSLAERMNAPIPAVLRSPSPGSPCLVGLLKPAILLPASEENQDTVEAEVLSHELAHLARHDCFWYLFARIMTALLWFQPLSWILSRRLMQASEEVCDDHVLDLGFNRNDYARRLAGIAERRQTALVAAVPMASLKSRLGRRVTRILDSSRSLSVRTGRRFVVTTTLAGLVLGGIVSQLGAGKAPSRKEAIEHIESLGGEVNGGCVTIPRKWSGTLADLGFLKAVGDVRKIWFSGTEFEEVRLEDLPELRRIVFNTNFFDEELKQQVVLKRLPIKTIRLANLPKLRELDALNMSETEITRLELDDMPGLVTLEVMGLQIGDGVLQSVSEAPNLTKVTAARPMSTKTTGRTHVTDAGLEGLASLKHLSDLSLDGARVTDAGMETIGRLTSLKTLSPRDNGYYGRWACRTSQSSGPEIAQPERNRDHRQRATGGRWCQPRPDVHRRGGDESDSRGVGGASGTIGIDPPGGRSQPVDRNQLPRPRKTAAEMVVRQRGLRSRGEHRRIAGPSGPLSARHQEPAHRAGEPRRTDKGLRPRRGTGRD